MQPEVRDTYKGMKVTIIAHYLLAAIQARGQGSDKVPARRETPLSIQNSIPSKTVL